MRERCSLKNGLLGDTSQGYVMADEKHGADRQPGPKKKGQLQDGQRADHLTKGAGGAPAADSELLKPDNKKSDNELKREQPDLRQHSQGHGAKQRDAG
jgi:hypothetical protein